MITKRILLALASLLVSVSAYAYCPNCGQVTNVQEIRTEGEGSGVGAVAGGVAGGLLGNQVGGGTGKKVATVVGIAGGAYAGHQVEKKVREKVEFVVSVRMDNGESRQLRYAERPAFLSGDRVKLENGVLVRIAQ